MTTIEPPAKTDNTTTDNGCRIVPMPKKPVELIQRWVTDKQVCILTFDRPNSSANLFDRAALEELNCHLNYVTATPGLRGLVITSDKPSIFIAGADIKALAQGARPDDVSELIQMGQDVFNRLADLPIPTVAAIHGACLGGGYEICLACDHRLASPDRCTKIGLPETMLGILPGWGGATRLPRLIGVPGALDIILAGKTLPAKAACKRGMIDAIVPRENLVDRACELILSAGNQLKRRRLPLKTRLTNSRLASHVIAGKVRKALLKKTRGHYPAVLKALQVVTDGIHASRETSLRLEREAVTELSQTPACHSLIQLFFLQERAKKLGAMDAPDYPPVKNIAVIGAGVMGAGIAQWASSKDRRVVLRDISPEQVAKGMATIGQLYGQVVKRRKLTPVAAQAGLDRISPAAEETPLPQVELVIEAAVERMDLKKQIFRRLDELTSPKAILATNTSALSVSDLAEATRHPERVVGIHFFNPVHRMQLVEVVNGRRTSPEVLHRAVQFVQSIGKLPVVVKDSPGFLVNRILMPYLIEAGQLFEGGAKVEDIDEAMLAFGMPMGPLRLIDEVGVDVSRHVAETLAGAFPGHLHVPDILDRLLDAGHLGRKSGQGFYQYDARQKHPAVHPALNPFRTSSQSGGLSREELSKRMVLLMINEAARCLEENVVASPEDADFGMVLGTGFAPFRGGPLRTADAMGIGRVVDEMEALVQSGEPHFKPCDKLAAMARDKVNFYSKKGDAK